jgi:hypothetical protein
VSEGRVADGCPGESSSSAVVSSRTLIGFDEASSLCSTGHTPNIITGMFLRILEAHFEEADKIENPELRDNIFKAQPNDTTEGLVYTGILIDPIYKWNPQNFSTRPAIYVKRNDVETERLGINDGLTVGIGKNDDGTYKDDEGEYHVRGMRGSHTLFCIGKTGAEAEVLSSEVYSEMQCFAPVLRRDLKLKRFEVVQAAEVSQLQEHAQHFVVPIVVAWYAFSRWRLRQLAPKLKTLSIGLEASV